MSILIILKLVGALALLIYGMKVMSEALQKMAGSQLRHILGAMTTNRITGMLTGTFITTAVQSSTATTVMTVSFVNAGLLTLAQAISVIMGANIGTTFTAWIMSAGFSFNMTSVVTVISRNVKVVQAAFKARGKLLQEKWIEAIRNTDNKVIITDGRTPIIFNQ